MATKAEDVILVNQYLNAELSLHERLEFEERLKWDRDLYNLYHETFAIVNGRKEGPDYLQVKLSSIEQEINEDQMQLASRPLLIWCMIFAIILILGSLILFMGSNAGEEVYDRYYEPYPNLSKVVERPNNQETLLEEALAYYEQGAYEDALFVFDLYLDRFPGNREVSLTVPWLELHKQHVTNNQDTECSPDEYLAMLTDHKRESRQNRKIQRLLKQEEFRQKASIEEINYNHQRNLDKNTLMRISTLDFITRHENIIITGPSGVGKSFLSQALGHQACISE